MPEKEEKKRKRKDKKYIQPVEIWVKRNGKTSNNINELFEVNNLYDEVFEKELREK